MHTLAEMTRFVGVFLRTDFTGETRHVRRIEMLADYESTGELPPLPGLGRRRTMPEGHTLRRLADDLTAAFAGRRSGSAARRAGSPPTPRCSTARRSSGPTRPASTCSWSSPGDRFIHIHLGLIGKLDLLPAPAPPPVGQVRLRLRTTTTYADLRGAIQCDLVGREQRGDGDRLAGPDPLRADADPAAAWARIRRSQRPIGDLLLDQTVIAGVGNVYRAEVLFRHRMHPLRPGRTLRVGQFRAIWEDLVALMHEGVRTGRIDTVHSRAHARGDGAPAARGRPRRRGLRLPTHRPALPGLRLEGPHLRAGRPKSLLVSAMSAHVPLARRTLRTTTIRTPGETTLAPPCAALARALLACPAGDVGLGPSGPGLPGAAHPRPDRWLPGLRRTSWPRRRCSSRCSSAACGWGRGRCRGSWCSSSPASASCWSTSRP